MHQNAHTLLRFGLVSRQSQIIQQGRIHQHGTQMGTQSQAIENFL